VILTAGGCETKKGSVEERRRPLEVVERSFRDLPASTGPVQKASLDEVGFVDVLEGAPVFLNSGGERLHPHRSATEFIDDRQEDMPIHLIETGGIDA